MRKRRSVNEAILREYVKSVLVEDEAGGNTAMFTPGGGYNAYDMQHSMGSGGLGDVSAGGLYDAFIGPFVDVFKTAVGQTKEITRRGRTLLNVALQTVLTTLIPIYGYNYADVFDKEKEDIEKIRSEYRDVYASTDEALKGPDATLLAFMASPALTLGAFAAKAAPGVTKELFSAVSGGISDDLFDGLKEKLEALGRWSLGDDGAPRKSSKSRGGPRGFFEESQIVEEKDNPKGKKDKGKVYSPKDLLKSKKMLKAVAESPKAQKMAAEATKVYRASLDEVYKQAEDVLRKAKTVEDLEKIAGKNAKGDFKEKIAAIKKLPAQEKAKAEKLLIDGSRKASKDFYVKSLTSQVDAVVKAGVPEESQYVKDYRAMISKIKAL